MKNVQNERKHLTPRQIINRFRKGEYVDEGIEAISSAISSCPVTFEGVAVPFPISIIEMVFENIGLARDMYELRKAGKDIDVIKVPDYPQLRDILIDLSEPVIWESLQDEKDHSFMDKIKSHGLRNRYILDAGSADYHKVDNYLSHSYETLIEEAGLCFISFKLALYLMFRTAQGSQELPSEFTV